MEYLYGLTKKDMKAIQQAFEKHSDRLEKVVLFGSRARGDFRDASDIDLAVFTWDLEEDLLSLKEENGRANQCHCSRELTDSYKLVTTRRQQVVITPELMV